MEKLKINYSHNKYSFLKVFSVRYVMCTHTLRMTLRFKAVTINPTGIYTFKDLLGITIWCCLDTKSTNRFIFMFTLNV